MTIGPVSLHRFSYLNDLIVGPGQDAWEVLINKSDLPMEDKKWILSRSRNERDRLKSLGSAIISMSMEERQFFLELSPDLYKSLASLCASPFLFIAQKEWLKSLDIERLKKLDSLLSDDMPLLKECLRQESDPAQLCKQLDVLLKMLKLFRLCREFSRFSASNSEYGPWAHFTMQLAVLPTMMDGFPSPFQNDLADFYASPFLEALEKEWFVLCLSVSRKCYRAIIEQGVNRGMFCGKDLRWLIDIARENPVDGWERELLSRAPKIYNAKHTQRPNFESLAVGYLTGLSVTYVTDGNTVLVALALLVTCTVLAKEYFSFSPFDEGSKSAMWPIGRSYRVGAATAYSIHALGFLRSCFALISLYTISRCLR